MMKTEPNYSVDDLAHVHVPVAIVQSEHDEFIKPEHADYLARSIPAAELIMLPGVGHFAPLQWPEQFDGSKRAFLGKVLARFGIVLRVVATVRFTPKRSLVARSAPGWTGFFSSWERRASAARPDNL
jgi:hypothetical protein